MSLAARITLRFAERSRYASPRSWLWTLYSSATNRLPLPGRGSVRRVWLRGHARPFAIRLGTTDYHVLREILIDGEYSELAPGGVSTIVDLGANVGFSIRLWQELFPDARVAAVEPDAGNIAVCRLNVEREDAAGHVEPVLIEACAAGWARSVGLDRSTSEWAYAMTPQGEGGGGIEALTIPQIMERAGLIGRIDLLKCDIEGAEEELFGTGGPWLDHVGAMVVELHGAYTADRFLADISDAGRAFTSVVVEKGPACRVVTARRILAPAS